jgi:hypothetical protein
VWVGAGVGGLAIVASWGRRIEDAGVGRGVWGFQRCGGSGGCARGRQGSVGDAVVGGGQGAVELGIPASWG